MLRKWSIECHCDALQKFSPNEVCLAANNMNRKQFGIVFFFNFISSLGC